MTHYPYGIKKKTDVKIRYSQSLVHLSILFYKSIVLLSIWTFILQAESATTHMKVLFYKLTTGPLLKEIIIHDYPWETKYPIYLYLYTSHHANSCDSWIYKNPWITWNVTNSKLISIHKHTWRQGELMFSTWTSRHLLYHQCKYIIIV